VSITALEQIRYPRETDDWRGFTHRQYNYETSMWEAYTGVWSYQIVPHHTRPTGTWLAAVTLGTQKGIDIAGLTVGYHWVFFRIDGQGSYTPVLGPVELVME
jgi:hypothetical protein